MHSVFHGRRLSLLASPGRAWLSRPSQGEFQDIVPFSVQNLRIGSPKGGAVHTTPVPNSICHCLIPPLGKNIDYSIFIPSIFASSKGSSTAFRSQLGS